jgi:hypothetical protein
MKIAMTIMGIVLFTGFASPCLFSQVDQGNQGANAKSSISDVFVFGTTNPIAAPASSSLTRTTNGVSVTVNTANLVPGNAHTLWWIIFNSPQHCATTPCTVSDLGNAAAVASVLWATGRVSDAFGQVVFTAHLVPGSPEGVLISGPGLINTLTAEIHVVVRTHGAALTGASLTQQLTTLNGGCNPTCANIQSAMHLP